MSENKQTKIALSLYRDPTDTKYVLVEVTYDPTDPNVKVIARDVREDVIDRFKMVAGDLFMGDNIQ